MQGMGLDAAAVNVIMVIVRLAMTGRAPAAAALQSIQAHIMHTIRGRPFICTAVHHKAKYSHDAGHAVAGLVGLNR